MTTRCRIGIENKESGMNGSIYCHSDGCPEHTGVYLAKYYSKPNQMAQLLQLGDISRLGKGYTEELSKYSWESIIDDDNIKYEISRDVTRAYKDRGDGTKIEMAKLDNRKQLINYTEECDGDYVYLNVEKENGERAWFYYEIGGKDEWVELTEDYVKSLEEK